jgi:glycine C-acetyltransferase
MTDAQTAPLTQHYVEELEAIRAQGLFKPERVIASPTVGR